MGVFPAAEWVHDELYAHYIVQRLGSCEGVTGYFYAIGTEKNASPAGAALAAPPCSRNSKVGTWETNHSFHLQRNLANRDALNT